MRYALRYDFSGLHLSALQANPLSENPCSRSLETISLARPIETKYTVLDILVSADRVSQLDTGIDLCLNRKLQTTSGFGVDNGNLVLLRFLNLVVRKEKRKVRTYLRGKNT